MVSTFHGLETAKRGMNAQQAALYTVGHNIANADTPGYTRQRVDFVQTTPYPFISKNAPKIPGHIGTGVSAGNIVRVREAFLDLQFRGENNKYGYYGSKAAALGKMEEILNEPTEEGLSKAFDLFRDKLQDLAKDSQHSGAREVVLAQANALADTFHYLSSSLNNVRDNYSNEIDIAVKSINSLTDRLNSINERIGEAEPHGYLPNDLYDERDRLLDELSQLVNIKVTPVKSGGNALDIAEGKYTIEIIDKNNTSIGTLVDGQNLTKNDVSLSKNTMDGFITTIDIGGNSVKADAFADGVLKGLVEAYGYESTTGDKVGLYPDMLDKLDKIAFAFVKEFNLTHRQGKQKDGNTLGGDFFEDITVEKGAAQNIKVLITDPSEIAAAADTGTINPGDGTNAGLLGEVVYKDFTGFGSGNNPSNLTGNIKTFYQGVVGSLGVDAKQMNLLANSTDQTRQAVELRRNSISSVSLDEEMTNMIKFQHAYNAAARNITMIDEMLDRIINGLGVGGR
ncbi:flagellar hook-associated protein FlgK [Metabacillus fastidiosus]|uniref:flagellar hook-associated protein FlgK n=1 Tax=Metabacillus fastidiosus TaxID=1458 RepID=UPI003D2798C1